MMKISEIVKDKPCEPLDVCPSCGSTEIQHERSMTTLVADCNDEDANHVTSLYTCSCGLKFERHHRYYNFWYARHDTGELLRGVPSCFEDFIYHCIVCGGLVKREHLKSRVVDNKVFPRVEFRCEACGHGGEVESQYYHPDHPELF